MRPTKLIPSHLTSSSPHPPAPPSSSSFTTSTPTPTSPSRARRRPHSTSSIFSFSFSSFPSTLSILFLFFCLLTAVYYVAIVRHDVHLSFTQLSDLERHVRTSANLSIYIAQLPTHPSDILPCALPAAHWRKVSARVDYVAFTYGPAVQPLGSWIGKVHEVFQHRAYGVVLFHCGCVVPNEMVRRTTVRFDGFECLMLPGLVVPPDSVFFVDIRPGKKEGAEEGEGEGEGGGESEEWKCPGKNAVMGGKWYSRMKNRLPKARDEHKQLRKYIESKA